MSDNKKGDLYLIPSLLGDTSPEYSLPPTIQNTVDRLQHFIVEHEKNARRFLITLGQKDRLDEIRFSTLNKHTALHQVPTLLRPAEEGYPIGLLSDAGCPAIADPGAVLVQHAHEKGVAVKPLTGPSSIFLALMGSGLDGQRFTFHGYLPHDKHQRKQALKAMERNAKEGYTQIFMETPFRNEKLFQELLQQCKEDTKLCLATDLTLPNETTRMCSIGTWKKHTPDLHKRPTIFLLGQ